MKKYSKNSYLLFISIIFLMHLHCGNSTDHLSPEENEALNAATNWLSLVDNGQYNRSWKMASPYLRSKITERQWEIGLEQIREPMGKVESRKVVSIKRSRLETKGNQKKRIVAQFSATFEHQNSVIEFITLQFEDNHEWQVAVYYIDR